MHSCRKTSNHQRKAESNTTCTAASDRSVYFFCHIAFRRGSSASAFSSSTNFLTECISCLARRCSRIWIRNIALLWYCSNARSSRSAFSPPLLCICMRFFFSDSCSSSRRFWMMAARSRSLLGGRLEIPSEIIFVADLWNLQTKRKNCFLKQLRGRATCSHKKNHSYLFLKSFLHFFATNSAWCASRGFPPKSVRYRARKSVLPSGKSAAAPSAAAPFSLSAFAVSDCRARSRARSYTDLSTTYVQGGSLGSRYLSPAENPQCLMLCQHRVHRALE